MAVDRDVVNGKDEDSPELAPIDEELDIIGSEEDVVSMGVIEEVGDCEDGVVTGSAPMKDDVGGFDREEDGISTGDSIGVNAKMSEVVWAPTSDEGVIDAIDWEDSVSVWGVGGVVDAVTALVSIEDDVSGVTVDEAFVSARETEN